MTQETLFVETAIGKLAVHDAGLRQGETLLLWPALFTSSALYQPQLSCFGSRYRLLLVDPPGVGASPDPEELLSMDDCARAAVQILDNFGIAKAHMIGTSWGGIVGAIVGRLAPDRFTSLMLCNTPFDHGRAEGLSNARKIIWLARLFGASALFANGVARSFFAGGTPQTADSRRRFLADFKGRTRKGLSLTAKSVLVERDSLLPDLPGIDVPALVVAGAEDALYPSGELRHAADMIPGAKFAELANSGHISAAEVPDAFNKLLAKWLAEHGAPYGGDNIA